MDILIPAAGSSSRMGGSDKLSREIDGMPLLRRTILIALTIRMEIIVMLRPDCPRRALIQDLPIEIRTVPDASEGLAASLRKGAEGAGPLMVLPADMPDIDRLDHMTMHAQHRLMPGRIIRACSSTGIPGHPVVFPAFLRPSFKSLTGDTGAKPILEAWPDLIHPVRLRDDHAITDLDTPEAWAAWEATRLPNR
jgi:CTP:molybdopterin cytidylyltransferase MocA